MLETLNSPTSRETTSALRGGRRNRSLVNPSELFLLCRSRIAAAHGSSFIKSTAGRAPLRALDVLEGIVSSRRSSVKGHHSIVRAPNHSDNIQ